MRLFGSAAHGWSGRISRALQQMDFEGKQELAG